MDPASYFIKHISQAAAVCYRLSAHSLFTCDRFGEIKNRKDSQGLHRRKGLGDGGQCAGGGGVQHRVTEGAIR